MIFIIDELDRCNPHYAVKVLERIKHLFNIPNIIFVLSIDKEQLSNSIRGYYGSESINADEYLKRFIDIEYALPDPDVEKFCSYLYDYYGFEAYERPRGTREIEESFLAIANILFMHKNLSLRQIEKIFAHIRLSLNMYRHDQVIYADLICLLTYLRICESDCLCKNNPRKLYYTRTYRSIRKYNSKIKFYRLKKSIDILLVDNFISP